MIKIASCQYQLELLADWKAYVNKITTLVSAAKQQGAQILLLPEYAGVEIACKYYASEQELFAGVQPLIPRYLELFQNLAQQYQLYIQAGTIVEQSTSNQFVNRAYFFGPDRSLGFQDKLQLIEFEKDTRVIQAGNEQTIFDTPFGKIGIAICYDSEFPAIVSRLTNAGAWLILVPSYTNSMAGYHRVLLSCRARAIENQCYVAISCVVGASGLSDATEQTMGQASILSPADITFPDNGIIAQGEMNKIETIAAELDAEKLFTVRKQGKTHNFEDAKKCVQLINDRITILPLGVTKNESLHNTK